MFKFGTLLIAALAISSAFGESGPCTSAPDGTTLPHPTSPQDFQICKSGLPRTLRCPSSLIFSPALNICTRPTNSAPSAVVQCPLVGSQNFTYPSNCAVYKECISGLHYYRTCPTGHEFHPTTLQCVPLEDMPPSAPCRAVDPEVPEEVSCKNKANGTYLSDKKDCAKFYICVDETPLPGMCPGELKFSEDVKYCVNPEEMPSPNQCGMKVPINPCKDVDDFERAGDSLVCSIWHTCFEGKSVQQDKCALDWIFVDNEKGCRPYEETMSELPCMKNNPVEACKHATDGTVIDDKDDQDCKGYFQCVEGVANKETCRPPLVFDDKAMRCWSADDLTDGARCKPVDPPTEE